MTKYSIRKEIEKYGGPPRPTPATYDEAISEIVRLNQLVQKLKRFLFNSKSDAINKVKQNDKLRSILMTVVEHTFPGSQNIHVYDIMDQTYDEDILKELRRLCRIHEIPENPPTGERRFNLHDDE